MQVVKRSPPWSVVVDPYFPRLGPLYEPVPQHPVQRNGNRWLFGDGMPPVDVIEGPDAIRLVAELPGVKLEDMRISLENNVLTLQGEKKTEERQEERSYRFERSYGTFDRSFTLPATIEADNIIATFDSGLLTVVLPKVEATKPRQITINVEAQAQ